MVAFHYFFAVKVFPARWASWRKRLYQPGWAGGLSLGMRPWGRGMLNGFLIMG